MATRKPAKPKKKVKAKPAPRRAALGNDPFTRGAAVREAGPGSGPPPPARNERPLTPELQVATKRPVLQQINQKPKSGASRPPQPPVFVPPAAVTPVRPTVRPGQRPSAPQAPSLAPPSSAPRAHAGSPSVSADPLPHAGAPTAQPLSGPTAHGGSPSVRADPRSHKDAPSAQPLSGPTAHGGSPSVRADPRPHAGAPTAQPLTGPTAHGGSPFVRADPRPHPDAPSAQPLSGPTAHGGSPSVRADPRPHKDAPSAQPLSGPTAHGGSPFVSADPRPHKDAPSAQPLSGPTAHGGSPFVRADPRPHKDAPSAQPLAGPTAHGGSPFVSADPRPHQDAPTAQVLAGPMAHGGSPFVSTDPRPLPPTSAPRSGSSGTSTAPLAQRAATRDALQSPSLVAAFKGLLEAVRSSAGLSSRRVEVDAWGKDTQLAASLRPLGELLYEKYWRVRVEGAEHLPNGPCIIVANHAGALPLDGPMMHLALRRERPELPESRWLLEDQIFHAPFVGVLANRLGAVRANPENALRLLEEGRPVVVFPEGFHGLSKPFSERYQLKRFGRGGYVKIALRAGVPIVPAAIIGGEESMPLLAKLPGGLFGVQYLPLTLPPLPAKWHLRFAPAVSLAGAPDEPEHDRAWVERKNFEIRDQIEAMLTDLLQHREHIF